MLDPFISGKGHVSQEDADKLVGKAGRVAHIASARPFVGALWGALAASQRAERAGAREAPPRTSRGQEVHFWRQMASSSHRWR